MRSQDKFRGCLIGGAAGDALGFAVEFLDEEEIFGQYGADGITAYRLSGGLARISDDTQMTLFTANGLLLGAAKGLTRNDGTLNPRAIGLCYQDWLKTQGGRYTPDMHPKAAWLGNVPELYSRRAPGSTCLMALGSGKLGTVREPINDSKGCGGVMRVAPIGLYFNDRGTDIREIGRLGAEAAAITHGHPLGWMPGAALALIVHEVSQDGAAITDAVLHALETVNGIFPDSAEKSTFDSLMKRAVDLAGEDRQDLQAIHRLGEGWVGEEALAIAVYCAVKHAGDIDGTLIAAVNHKGDSDSTGAIAGNIVGAQVGLSGIPAKYTEHLELRDLILEVADDLWRDAGSADDPAWQRKYGDFTGCLNECTPS